MRVLSFSLQKIAILCAVLLLVLSAGAYSRHVELFGNLLGSSLSDSSATSVTDYSNTKEPTLSQKTSTALEPTLSKSEETAQVKDYSYIAVAGDSYTALARDAISKYTAKNNITLNESQLLSSEVQLATEAGSPMLDVGEKVSIPESSLSQVLGISEISAVSSESSSTNPQNQEDAEVFEATAYSGDSYVSIAREAIREYSAANQTNLTDAQKIAAETLLAQAANWPELDELQKVIIDMSSVNNAVSSAKSLSAQDQELWQNYVNT